MESASSFRYWPTGTLPLDGVLSGAAVTPDGGEVVFTAKVVPGSEPAWSTDYDLYAVKTDGSGEMRCITEANEAWDTEPVFTPDGKTLFLAVQHPATDGTKDYPGFGRSSTYCP